MNAVDLDADDVARCAQLADVLIPGTDHMPAVASLPCFEGLLRTAVRTCGHEDTSIRKALNALPRDITWDTVRIFADENVAHFRITSQLVSAAYYMAPDVLEGLSYPVNRRHPAREDEFADEFGTGILDSVMARGPFFRDPRNL